MNNILNNLNSLLTAINSATGNTDTNLTSAVSNLIRSSGNSTANIAIGETIFVPQSDALYSNMSQDQLTVSNPIGKQPDVVIIYSDYSECQTSPYSTQSYVGGILIDNKFFGLPQVAGSTILNLHKYMCVNMRISSKSKAIGIIAPTSGTYTPADEDITSNTIKLWTIGDSAYFRGGKQYHILCIKFGDEINAE